MTQIAVINESTAIGDLAVQAILPALALCGQPIWSREGRSRRDPGARSQTCMLRLAANSVYQLPPSLRDREPFIAGPETSGFTAALKDRPRDCLEPATASAATP
jgi:hypothetical protein